MLSENFIRTYATLNKSHANGSYIWMLCEMSCFAVSEGDGEVRRLAEYTIPKIDTDVIYRRRNAWVGWQVFQKVPEDRLVDDHGDIAEGHESIREYLSYSHFELVGRRWRQGLLRSRYDVAHFLVNWARENKSVRKAGLELTEIVGQYSTVSQDVKRLRRAAAKVLGYGDGIPLRLYRYASVVAGRDWLNEENTS